MNIKFKKMFKRAIIFFTVFVMIFNSFAAISVSDGSAFVTKAEFSADLNNLSNRMSALENSIDAKIDSLVSSYLSRNGIWNGERQTVNKNTTQNSLNYFYAVSGFGATDRKVSTIKTGINFYLSLPHQVNNLSPRTPDQVYIIKAYGNVTYDLVTEITKSGLICVNYAYKAQTGAPYIAGSINRYRLPSDGIGRTGIVTNKYQYGWSLPINWSFYEANTSGSKVGEYLYTLSQPFNNNFINSYETMARYIYTDSYSSFYAFVSKGNKLMLECTIGGNGFHASYAESSFWNDCYIASESNNISSFTEGFGLSTSVTVNNIYVY